MAIPPLALASQPVCTFSSCFPLVLLDHAPLHCKAPIERPPAVFSPAPCRTLHKSTRTCVTEHPEHSSVVHRPRPVSIASQSCCSVARPSRLARGSTSRNSEETRSYRTAANLRIRPARIRVASCKTEPASDSRRRRFCGAVRRRRSRPRVVHIRPLTRLESRLTRIPYTQVPFVGFRHRHICFSLVAPRYERNLDLGSGRAIGAWIQSSPL